MPNGISSYHSHTKHSNMQKGVFSQPRNPKQRHITTYAHDIGIIAYIYKIISNLSIPYGLPHQSRVYHN